MQKTFNLIIELLTKHTCVIIPDFGGFVVNDRSASVTKETNRFFPPQKELIFNSNLTHNDGLLAHAMMKKDQVSFDEADKKIASMVRQMKAELKETGICRIEDFGFFTEESGRLIFHAKNIKLENKESFGLKEFFFPSLEKEEKKSEKTLKHNLFRPYVITIAAAIALLFVLQPVVDKKQTDMASFSPSISFSEVTLRAELDAQKQEIANLQTELEKYKELSANYYVVVADFDSEEDASEYINAIDPQGKDSLSVMHLQEKSLVTYACSNSAQDLSLVVDSISQYAPFQDAYVLSIAKMNK